MGSQVCLQGVPSHLYQLSLGLWQTVFPLQSHVRTSVLLGHTVNEQLWSFPLIHVSAAQLHRNSASLRWGRIPVVLHHLLLRAGGHPVWQRQLLQVGLSVPLRVNLLHVYLKSSIDSICLPLHPQVFLRGLSERSRRSWDVRLVEAAGPVDLLPMSAAPSPRRPDAQGGLERPGSGGLRQQQCHGLRECSTHCDPVYTS